MLIHAPIRYAVLLLAVSFTAQAAWSGEPLRIAVAANFRATLQGINEVFERETGQAVKLSSASTGALYTQIRHGAPFDIFFSADKDTALRLASDTGLPGGGVAFCYATGTLVLAGGDGSIEQLADPENSLAIANPLTAPYGKAAVAILERDEFASGVNRKLVRGTNVIQSYQFWFTGATDLALLPKALAKDATPIPKQWYPAVEQYAVALAPTERNEGLAQYLEWLRSDRVQAMIIKAGYEPCS
ncbi:MAG: molybdate ABC transporter substrate-binding protein [Pseudomonadota bacterium]